MHASGCIAGFTAHLVEAVVLTVRLLLDSLALVACTAGATCAEHLPVSIRTSACCAAALPLPGDPVTLHSDGTGMDSRILI